MERTSSYLAFPPSSMRLLLEFTQFLKCVKPDWVLKVLGFE